VKVERIGGVRPLEPGGHIDCIPRRRVLALGRTTDRPHDHRSGVDSHPYLEFINSNDSATDLVGVGLVRPYTEAAVRRLGIEGIAQTMTAQVESVDQLGDVQLWVQDMHPVWERRRNEHAVVFEPSMTTAVDIGLPPEVVSGYLRQPAYRSMIQGGRVAAETNKAGRIGPESRFQCYHGKAVLTQRVVEWTPFERIASQDTDSMPLMNKLTWKNEYRLLPTESGTRLTIGMGHFEGSWLARKSITSLLSKASSQFQGRIRAFAAAAEADWAGQQASADAAPTIVPTPESIRDAAGSTLRIP
jgi:hypothetical protein